MTLRNRFNRGVVAALTKAAGGPARLRVIAVLALVVGLEAAGNGTVGALAVPLKQSFGIDNTQVGLLVTVSTGIGAIATLLGGALADHVNRIRILWIAVLLWSAAMALSGASVSYGWLLACRVAMGAMVAVAGPVVASLIGDYFPARERGRIYGLVLAGQGTSTAAGLLLSGALGAITWRLGFWWLAAAGIGLAVAVARLLPEPNRGGGSPIPFGATQSVSAAETAVPVHDRETPAAAQTPDRSGRGDMVIDEVMDQRMRPHPGLVLREDPQTLSLWWAVRYVLSIRTNVVLFIAATSGYFVFTGLATFALALMRERFGIGQALSTLLIAVIGIGALIGVLTAGRIADWLIARGHVSARMTVAGSAFLAACAFLLPALLADDLAIAVMFAFIAAIGLGGVSPPLNAGRLDIMHSRLWGRAEAVRTTLRSVFIALAPLVFGYVSTQLSPQAGLQQTFLIMLTLLFVAGALIVFVARRTYPRDVATAVASERATQKAK